jgi:hypothetical protein
MIWFKSCPRCGGDLYEELAIWGREIKCLQCSRALDDRHPLMMRGRAPLLRAEQAAQRLAS